MGLMLARSSASCATRSYAEGPPTSGALLRISGRDVAACEAEESMLSWWMAVTSEKEEEQQQEHRPKQQEQQEQENSEAEECWSDEESE